MSRTFFNHPWIWTVEMAQFVMAAYYTLGGAYTLIMDGHVRMDLAYAKWSPKNKALADVLTFVVIMLYLVVLLLGGIISLEYSIKYKQKSYSSWAPPVTPIKIIMVFGMFLMILQVIAEFFKDLAAKARGKEIHMSFEMMAILMFVSMLVMLLTGRHIFAVIGGVAVAFSLLLWGAGGEGMTFHASFSLLNWYPLLTLPLFIYIGYMFSKSGIADDLYQMLYVWMGPVRGGLAIGTIVLMAIIAAINGLSVAGMAVGNTICLPEMVKRKYDKIMISGVIQAASSLGIMIPPSVVLVLYGMIARQPVGQLWMAGVLPGIMLAVMFIIYIMIRCFIQPQLGPAASKEERNIPWSQKFKLLSLGHPAHPHHLPDVGPVLHGGDQPGGELRGRGHRHHHHRPDQQAADLEDHGRGAAGHPERELHVHVGHPGRAGLRRGLRRTGRGVRHREAVPQL